MCDLLVLAMIFLLNNSYVIISLEIAMSNGYYNQRIIDKESALLKQIHGDKRLGIENIRSVFKDRQENIWIGSSGGGLYKLTQNNFQHLNANSGLRGNRVYAVHQHKHETWISTSNQGVTKIDSTGITPIFADNGYLNVKVGTIASDSLDNIWVGTQGKGILIFKRKYLDMDTLKQVSKFNKLDQSIFPNYILETDTLTTDDGLASNYIKKILIENDQIWLASYNSGIQRIKYNQLTNNYDVVENYNHNNGIKDLQVNDMKIGPKGKLWYVTQKGNVGYIKDCQVYDYYRVFEKEIPISTILFDERDNGNERFVIVGTLGEGLWILWGEEPRNKSKIEGYKELNSKNIFQIIFDDEENLWVGTEKGVNKIILKSMTTISDVFYFDKNDGFLGIETCQNAIARDPEGNIWFGTMNGISKYIPEKVLSRETKPTIHFEKIEVVYQTLEDVNFNQFSDILTLEPSQNHLSFQFKSVDINHPKDIEYRWKLNSKYGPWTSKKSIDFANLKAGNYEFTVQSRNIDWIESDPVTFNFLIEKPLLQKFWFKATLYAGLGLVVLLVTLLMVKRYKKRNQQKLEQLELENHLLSLEQKALQLQMNPHFIFNVLNGIKAMGSEGETDQMNSTINTFATLLRSILNSSRKEEISLQEEISTLNNYLTLEQQMVAKPFDFEIVHETNGIDVEEILIPPMLIQPFVENSVKHGFQHNSIKGKIDIRFMVEGEFLKCEIKDNGIGIEQSKLKKKSHHPSTALKVTKERIESLTKEHQLIIKEDNGTIVSFRLPLKIKLVTCFGV